MNVVHVCLGLIYDFLLFVFYSCQILFVVVVLSSSCGCVEENWVVTELIPAVVRPPGGIEAG